MENKEITTTKKITTDLIAGWLFYLIPFGLLYSFFYKLMDSKIDQLAIKCLIGIIVQGVIILVAWKLSTRSAFKKRTITLDNVSKVMRNLTIFTIIVLAISGFSKYLSINKLLNAATNYNNAMLAFCLRGVTDEEVIAEYSEKVEENTRNLKNETYTYLALVETGFVIVYLGALAIEKKEIIKYATWSEK